MTLRLNVPDLLFATFLVALGAFAYAAAGELRVGTAAVMGPGYVPKGLALIIMIYGAALGVRAAFAGVQAMPAMAWRPLLMLSAAVVVFAVVLPLGGLALTSFLVVVCAGVASYDVRLRENALLGAALAAFAVVLFVAVLGLPIPVWPAWT